MRTTDNNGGKSIDKFDNLNIADLSVIANRNLLDLQNENPDLLVFPHSFGKYRDDVEKPPIFSLDNENLTTYNLMGFIGRNSVNTTQTDPCSPLQCDPLEKNAKELSI